MQHFIYPEKQYRNHGAVSSFTVDYDHERGAFKFETVADSGRVVNHLTVGGAAMLAGFLLSKHPATVKGDVMAFSVATRACAAIPEPDFAVIPHEWLAKSKEPDTKDNDQGTKVTVTSPDPESAKRAGKAFADYLSNMWVAKDVPVKDTTHPSPVLTEAQYEEMRRLAADAPTDASPVVSRTWVAQDDDQDTGDLHPDQERRLTALREATKIFAGDGRLTHERLHEWAGWILNGDTPTN